MCRVLSYLGQPILLTELFYNSDNSFISQSYNPKYMSDLLNLAGFGLAVWVRESYQPALPFLYQTLQLPFYDKVLHNFSSKIISNCLLAHLRGVDYTHQQIISLQNVHPFLFQNVNIVFAHNGDLFQFEKMKFDLLEFILPQYQKQIHGTTDSEWVYAVFLSQLATVSALNSTTIKETFCNTIRILKKVRAKHNIHISSPLNLFISNGEFIAAIRYVIDYGNEPSDENKNHHTSEYHSLWYTLGERFMQEDESYLMKKTQENSSIIIASEPLTSDVSHWVELPEYSFIMAERDDNKIVLVKGKLEV